MSRTTSHDSADQRLARLLDSPSLARVVPHLPPETLHQLIRHQGLDACGDVIASATPAQLTSLADLDLWRHAPAGRDDQFDVERFAEWIEVLVDTGDAIAARTVAALDPNLIVAGLSRYVRVFDPGIFEPTAQTDDERIELQEAMREGDAIAVDEWRGDRLTCELGGYIVRAKRGDAWDSIIALLFALESEHADCFHAVMRGCRALSNSRPEASGFHDLLMEPEQHLHDVTTAREQRRSRQGYATAADARAFLQMARQPRASSSPIAAAYFRAASDDTDSASTEAVESTQAPEPDPAIVELVAEAGVTSPGPRALLEQRDSHGDRSMFLLLRRLLAHVHSADANLYATRSQELAFLANTLLSGCSIQSRAFTPREASEAAASICNLGLEYSPTPPSDSLLIDHDLVSFFELGWAVLHRDVCIFAGTQLLSTLDGIRYGDLDTRRDLARLRRELSLHLDAGEPWLARSAADVLAVLDVTAWTAVAGLLQECPVMPAALHAILRGRTTTVSATDFDFISSATQIGDVRDFMEKLPDLLSR